MGERATKEANVAEISADSAGYLREKFSTRYAEQVNLQLSGGKQASEVQVDMRLSVMKELNG